LTLKECLFIKSAYDHGGIEKRLTLLLSLMTPSTSMNRNWKET